MHDKIKDESRCPLPLSLSLSLRAPVELERSLGGAAGISTAPRAGFDEPVTQIVGVVWPRVDPKEQAADGSLATTSTWARIGILLFFQQHDTTRIDYYLSRHPLIPFVIYPCTPYLA